MVGEKPYEVGSPSCKNYGLKPSSKYHGLCATEKIKDISNTRNSLSNSFGYKQNDFIPKTLFSTSSFYTNVYNNDNSKQTQHPLEEQPITLPPSKPTTTRRTTTTRLPQTTTSPSPPATKGYSFYRLYPLSTQPTPNSIFAGDDVDRSALKSTLKPWTYHKKTKKPLTTTTPLPLKSTEQPTRRTGWSLLTWRG